MADSRKKDAGWSVLPDTDGRYSFAAAHLAVLMDIRDELKSLNRLLHCSNFISIPDKLNAIRRNTAKPRKKVQ